MRNPDDASKDHGLGVLIHRWDARFSSRGISGDFWTIREEIFEYIVAKCDAVFV
jgi:hypothetical protein